jgi:hypothetical protein
LPDASLDFGHCLRQRMPDRNLRHPRCLPIVSKTTRRSAAVFMVRGGKRFRGSALSRRQAVRSLLDWLRIENHCQK